MLTTPARISPFHSLGSLSHLLHRVSALVVLVAAGIGVVSAQTTEKTKADSPPRPNVVFILADDMGFSDAGCYGGEMETPHLDALAAGGLRFTQFYNTTRCGPTRSALMTGYFAQAIRCDAIPGLDLRGRRQRPAWAPLLPALIKPLGYRSYHSGKWHLDGKTQAGGFDHAYTLDDHNRYFAPEKHTRDDEPLPAVKSDSGFYATTAIADHAIECLKDHATNHAGQPFFQYVAFISPHFPLHALQADIDRFRARYQVGWNEIQAARGKRLKELGIAKHDPPAMERELGPPYAFPDDIARLGPGEVNRPLPWQELTGEQRAFQAQKMAIHAAMIYRMDQEIGRIVAQLKAMNAYENTLILFASDNGASAELMVRGDGHAPAALAGSGQSFLCLGPGWSSAANTPHRRHKTWVHEGGISTPLIAHWPQGIAARGELRRDPAHLVDIVPTVLELVGGQHPTTGEKEGARLHGTSLVPAFASDGVVKHDDLWWLHEGNRAIRVGDWKLVAAANDPWELYDLRGDRGESNNLAASHPEKVSEMAARWDARLEEFRKLASAGLPAATKKGKRK